MDLKKIGTNRIIEIVIRYTILLVIGIFMEVFYVVFKPLTIYPVCYILGLFFDVGLSGSVISATGVNFEIINACIAGSAFFLLTILNFMVGKINFGKRIKSLLFSYISMLVLNILRIVLLIILAVKSVIVFSAVHMFFFYVISILLVFVVWTVEIKLFKIKEIPLYSDLKELVKIIKSRI
ncbi:hypothetical protein COV16_00620 [Candidatus Woesearchaeota archaeon CG10_big_fil_rev_8_21_14_0_10_34_8]|nr:MAG: hypothetical protein COV16_00620 [Candidatus Woesearchaeota archaeon CG10_big_fil_rev_8_21_14_0_10_34_8]